MWQGGSFTIRRRKALILCCALFCLCGVLATLTYQHRSAATSAAVDNWGLSFQQEGAPPVGNASADFLSTYDAWYVGDTGQPVIYLTFDAGFENGNTPAILDALKKQRPGDLLFGGQLSHHPARSRAPHGG